jgi:hypothetical protein
MGRVLHPVSFQGQYAVLLRRLASSATMARPGNGGGGMIEGEVIVTTGHGPTWTKIFALWGRHLK